MSALMGDTRIGEAILAGMNPQHFIVSGLGATPNDSNGLPLITRYIVSSGNLLADFRYNVAAESQGSMHACRLFEMTDDRGVRDMLHFDIAHDTMHQNQWLAAIEQIKTDGLEDALCPGSVPQRIEDYQSADQFLNHSAGAESDEGRWASVPSIDGQGQLTYAEHVEAGGGAPVFGPIAPPRPRHAAEADASDREELRTAMPPPHDLALFTLTSGCGIGSLLMADAADEALRRVPAMKRRRAALLIAPSRIPIWARPAALHCASLGFLAGMAAFGAVLLGAFP